MNDPKKLNGWTGPMMVTLAERYTILQILLRHGKYDMSETKQEMAILSFKGMYCCNQIFFILFGLRNDARSVLNSSRREDVLLIYFEQIFTCEKIHV